MAIIKTKKAFIISNEGLKVATTYSPTFECSTICAGGLNCSVRNGKRCFPLAIATNISLCEVLFFTPCIFFLTSETGNKNLRKLSGH